ncbi:MAG TPA: histidine kinase dimerization/phospho-acceptor domain-containing protein [Candidatus Binatia bacterium]|jgi:signal transduction histidine kinase
MKTLWFQLLLWFGITFIAVSGTFLFLINLENKVDPAARTSVQASSSQPVTDTVQPVEESPTKSSRSTVRLQSAYGLAMLLAFAIVAFILAKKMLAPLRSLNAQLDLITPRTLARKVWVQGDMTELQLLVEQINALLARMHIALMNLQQFSSQVAHELRMPLTVMRLKLEQAAEKIDPQLAEEIQSELLRLTLHVEQALLIARAEQGQISLNRVTFDIEPLLLEIVDDFRLLADDEGREIRVSSSPATVYADPNYMRQILHNLFANALKHGRGIVRARLRSSRGRVSLLVLNTPKPISDEELNLGLGTRLVAALVGAHGNIGAHFRSAERLHVAQLVFIRPDTA